jgi:hypothetical protein
LLTILYVSKAIVLIRLICKEGTRAFSRRLIYELVYSSYTKRSALSCTFSNFFEFVSVQKCQAKGQKLKLLKMKVWNIVNLLNLSKYRPKRLSIFSCCDAFLQIELIECFACLGHRGSQLYFHITSWYVLKRRREDTFWGQK